MTISAELQDQAQDLLDDGFEVMVVTERFADQPKLTVDDPTKLHQISVCGPTLGYRADYILMTSRTFMSLFGSHESEGRRKHLSDWVSASLLTRLRPGGRLIVVSGDMRLV